VADGNAFFLHGGSNTYSFDDDDDPDHGMSRSPCIAKTGPTANNIIAIRHVTESTPILGLTNCTHILYYK
jgi:hypothetical protein